MEIQLWQAALAYVPLLGALGAALPKLLQVRSLNRQTDARTLAEAYGHVIDRLEGEVSGLREHVTELLKLINARDQEIASLRAENTNLRGRVESLERTRRG